MESAEQTKALMKANCWNTSGNPKMHKQKLHIGVEKYNFKKDRKQVYVDDNFVFPPGYRFCPQDHELITYYLRKKILKEVLPHNKIKEVNLYKHTPEELSEKYEVLGDNEWYFFTPRDRKYPNGDRPNRAAGTGYWKATGADKDIKQGEVKIGCRKSLVFYHGKPPKGDKTNWIMHEYRVKESRQLKAHAFDMKLDDWVLCRIYKRESKSKNATRKQEEVSKNNSPLPVMVVDKLENVEIMDNSCVEFAKQQFGSDDPNFSFDFSNYNPDYFPHYGADINIQPSFSPPATLLSDSRELYQESNISPPATFLCSPPATLLLNPGELYDVSNVSPPATLVSNPTELDEVSNVSPPATLVSNPSELYDISNISPPATLLLTIREMYELCNITPPASLLSNPGELYEVVSNTSHPATLLSDPRELYVIVRTISPLATLPSDPREMYEVSNISPPATSLSNPSELCEESNVSPPPATSPSDSQ